MRNNIYIIIIFSVIFAGCRDEFIEAEPKAKILENNFYQTDQQMYQALVAAYDPLQWTYQNGTYNSIVMLGEIRSDNANAGGAPSGTDLEYWQNIDDLVEDPFSEAAVAFWKKNWWGVYRTNLFIANSTDGSELLTPELINSYQAEAKFLRAYYHFELFNIFGPVPILDYTVTAEDYTSVKRATVTELFEFLTNELKEAIEILPDDKYTGINGGRVSKTTAQALLGKVYLYWADYLNDDQTLFDQAATQFQAVINSGQYQLLDDFNELFSYGVKNSEESVFEIQFSNLVAADFGSVEFVDGNLLAQLAGVRGLCLTHPDYREGWGFMLPTASLNNHFLGDDEVRRDAAILSVAEIIDAGCAGFNLTSTNGADFEGFWQQKYANFKEYSNPNTGAPEVLRDANQPMIRYADVLLMAAEALVRGTGSEAVAIGYINQVRERAAGPGDNTGGFRTANDLITDEGFSLLEVIWYERRAELAGEGHRWFDLVRSGRASANLFDGVRSANFSSDKLFLAIPQTEIDNTAGSLTAYPNPELFQ